MAIILPVNRPLLRIGEVESFIPEAADAILRTAESVARLEIDGHPNIPWLGTAFVVGPDLVLTAGHHVEAFTKRTPDGWEIDPRYDVYVSFGAELRSNPRVFVAACLLKHPVLDVALLRLASATPNKALVLNGSKEIEPGELLATIGYYSADFRSDQSAIDALGEFRHSEKVFSFGAALAMSVDRFYKRSAWSLVHDCTTLGGFGGSPVLHRENAMVVGLHFAGNYLDGNFAVPMSELARDVRIRELGVQFSADTPGPDADAFESDYVAEGMSGRPAGNASPAAKFTERKQYGETELDSIDNRLRDKLPNLDDALNFIREFGSEYARTIELQPGRNRVSDAEYQRAVIDALNRRGLVNEAFVSTLNPPEKLLAEEYIQPLLDHIIEKENPRLVNEPTELILGSPYYDCFLNPAGKIDSIPAIIRRLSNESKGEKRDALAWLIKQLDDGSDPILRALEALGETRLDLPTLGGPRSDGDMVEISFLLRAKEAAKSVCVVKSETGGSTGWLIAADLVVCPAHLTTVYQVDVAELWVEFEDAGPDAPPTTIRVASVESHDNKTDLMILRLVSPPPNRSPLQMELTQPASGAVMTIHYPLLKRQMISFTGGNILHNDGHTVLYTLATSHGSGGAPILTKSLKVIATHRGFRFVTDRNGHRIRAKFGTCVEALVSHFQERTGKETLWRRIVGAQDGLRSIDAGLLALDEHESATVIVELVDEETVLPNIDGLSIVARYGEYMTATVDLRAVQVLTKTQGVVSVSASGRSTSPECTRSLPFIGVPFNRVGLDETGDQALIAVIDDGIDPFHQAFWDGNQSCIDLYWDQRGSDKKFDGPTQPTKTYSDEARRFVEHHKLKGGSLYLGSDFHQLDAPHRARLHQGVLHGTAVASIAAGRKSGDHDLHFSGGIAIGARLIVVRYDREGTSIGSSAGHLSALDLIDRRAAELKLPVVVNISNGMNSGAHDGTSKVERRCAQFVSQAGRVVVKSAGNECGEGRHAQFEISDVNRKILRWTSKPMTNPPREGESDELELWFGTHNQYDLTLIDPNGHQSSSFPIGRPLIEKLSTLNVLQCTYEPLAADNRRKSRVNVKISHGDKKAVQPGEWKLGIQAKQFRGTDLFHAWLEEQQDRILQFKADVINNCTVTVPGTGTHVITVGAIEASDDKVLYDKSSHGPNSDGIIKPDLVAPGVSIAAALANSDRDRMHAPESGTSFAAPHVTGVIALALSMAQKTAEACGTTCSALNIDADWIRQLLVNSLDDFNLRGSHERGHGRLNAKKFVMSVRQQLNLLTGRDVP